MVDIEWESREASRGRPYDRKASTIHGWVTKMRGTLFDNESVRRQGIREMKIAKAIRAYKRQRAAERKARGEGGGFLSFFKFGGSRRSSGRRRSDNRVVLTRDASSRSHGHGRQRSEPFLHFSHRTKPHHHGHGTRIIGHITQRQDLVTKGVTMNESAKREREREKRRRRKQRERDGQNMRRDASRSTRR